MNESTSNETYIPYVDEKYKINDISWNSSTGLDTRLMKAAEPDMRVSYGENAEIITKEELLNKNVIENEVLLNVYEDPIMGNVILNPLNDCSYRKPTYRPELAASSIELINRIPQWTFTWSEGVRSMIANPFKGKALEGCTISMWVRVPSYFSLTERSALFTFLGTLNHYEHPDPNLLHNIENDTWTTPYLTIDAALNIGFQESHQNWYAKELEGATTTFQSTIPPYRKALGRKWEFMTFVFTNEEINTYVNGVKIEYTMEYKGKRFNGGNGEPGNSGMCTLMEFLTSEDTNLYLGLTITSDEGKCDQIMYKNIAFYDEAANDEEAVNLFYEEIELFNQK